MLYFDSIENALDNIKILENIYYSIRVVNPETKEIVTLGDTSQPDKFPLCYQFWDKEQICENCISIRALQDNHTIVKIGIKTTGIYTVTAVPVLVNNQKYVMEFLQDVTGNLCFDTGEFCDNPNQFMLSITNHIDHLLTRDELTGLYNRRYINESLPPALFDAYKKHHPMSIIYSDIDYFKMINDSYGHLSGDHVLRQISKIFQNYVTSDIGWTARYGGDEFLICLPEVDNKTAIKIAEKLRKAIMKEVIRIEGHPLHITNSFGVYTINVEKDILTVQDIITLADKNLYLAKENGRNKVI